MEITVNKGQINGDKPLIIAIPDTGLISVIIASQMIEQLELKEVGYLTDKNIQSIILLESGVPKSPIRIYSSEEFTLIRSEIPLIGQNLSLSVDFAEIIQAFIKENGIKSVFFVSGIPDQQRPNINKENLEIFALGSTKEDIRELRNITNVNLFETGVISGTYANIISMTLQHNIPLKGFYINSFPNFPDPTAAAKMISKIINPVLGLELAVTDLLEKGDQVQLQYHSLASQHKQMQSTSSASTYL